MTALAARIDAFMADSDDDEPEAPPRSAATGRAASELAIEIDEIEEVEARAPAATPPPIAPPKVPPPPPRGAPPPLPPRIAIPPPRPVAIPSPPSRPTAQAAGL